MKSLLILGAGGHGKVVAEVAADCGYQKINFLDDNAQNSIGKISDLERFNDTYTDCFIGIGNNTLRLKLLEKAEAAGYTIPVLIHPTAYVSKTAVIEKGTIVEPHATINANTLVKKGSIVSVGAIVDHDVVLENAVHINAGAIVKAGGRVFPYEKLEAGEVRLGYQTAENKTAPEQVYQKTDTSIK